MKIIGIPVGLRDSLTTESALRQQTESKISDLLKEKGFASVRTPILEYYDAFLQAGSPIPQEVMLRVDERNGKICVLRPDSTIPIARIAATKLVKEPRPLKLCYIQPVFRSLASARSKEISQAGVEYIGAGSNADAEVLQLMETIASAFGLSYHIELSHTGLIKSLIHNLGLDKEELLHLIEARSFASLSDLLKESPNTVFADALKELITFSGNISEALTALKKLPLPEEGKRAVAELEELSALLPMDNIIIDGGLSCDLEYYSGLIFKLYALGAPKEIISGGRYDGLLARFGNDEPAIGFCIDLDELMSLGAVL